MSEPVRIPVKHWRSRWLVLPSWRVLHRVNDIFWEGEEMIVGIGTAACGASGRLMMPGIFSRMDLPRCKHCCRKLGIPAGGGAPFNDKALTRKQRGV